MKSKYLDKVRNKNRLVLIDRKVNRIRMTSFVRISKNVSPKTDRFLFISYAEIGTIYYIAFKHLRNRPILRWDKCGLPAGDVQLKFAKKIGETPYKLLCVGN